MNILNTHSSDLYTSENVTVNGVIDGQLIVNANHRADINGKVAGDVIVHGGAIANVYGTITGNVINNGGVVEIHGVVTGSVTTLAGRTKTSSGAKIGASS